MSAKCPTSTIDHCASRRALLAVRTRSHRALRLFETFAGCKPQRTQRQRMERLVPEVLVDLGALRGLIYTKSHEARSGRKRTYIHFMEDPPRLMCDADGRRLFVVGGTYRITRRGIEG